MKKLIALILSFLLLMTTAVNLALAVAADTPVMTVGSVESYQGDTVTLYVTLENNPGFSAASVKIDFDNTNITLINAELCEGFAAGAFVSYDNLPYITFVKSENTTESEFLKLTFTIAENAELGDISVTVLYTEGDISDIDENNVNFNIVPGKISIKEKPVPVTGIALNKQTASIGTGDGTLTLTPIFSPETATNKNVAWSSSDNSVATVKNGVVTPLKKGTATITVTTEDGNFSASCVVTVNCSHLHTTEHSAEPSTCIKRGHRAYTVCDDCGEITEGSDAELPLSGHTGGTATCVKKAVCDVCHQEYGDFAAHNYIENASEDYLKTAATCGSKAVYYKSCSVCGLKSEETFETGEYDYTNHVGETYLKNQKEATCYEEGYTGDTYCLGCGTLLSKGTVIAATGHTGVVTKEAKAPTCTEAGWTEEIRCSICDEILQPSEPIAALGHSFTNYISDNNATCTENGTETAKCDRCDATDTRTVPGSAQGHEFVKYIADGNAACEADGTATASCKRCGTTETIVIVGSALGHDMEERRTEPGFTFEGAVQNVCDRCGEMEINQILPKKKIETALTDVTSDQWFAYAIGYCLDYKLMQGTSYASDGRQIFLPDTSMTRAELVTVLYNMEGRPEVSYEAVFTDVTENQWFAPQIIWAYRQGIAAGTTKTTFAPDEAITREQIAAILYRYATDYLGLSMSAEDEDALLGAFSDAGEISDYARTAMAAMNQAGVITGDGNRLKPQENATRAEVASMLSRYLPNVLQADQTND